MAIESDYSGIKDYEQVCYIEDEGGKRLNPVTYALVVPLSLHIGMWEITEHNAGEWYTRVKMVEACFGGGLLVDSEGKTVGITPEDIQAHIGLKLTGSMWYTRAQFMRHLNKDLMPELAARYKNATQVAV